MVPPVFPYLVSLKVLDNLGQEQRTKFREPRKRIELDTPVEFIAQIRPQSMETLSMWAGGRDLESTVFLYAFRMDLTRRGLIDPATGMPTAPKIGDRVDTIKNGRSQIVVKMPDPPGAFVDAVVPASFGPGGMNALYEVRLNARRSSR